MAKIEWKAGNMLYPLPAALVSCGTTVEDYNLITIAWTGTICTNPPMVYVSIRKSRHSHKLIKDSGCFAINLTTKAIAHATDWCGVKSGKNVNKFKETGLTWSKCPNINAPMLNESPVNIECEVVEIKELGSHDMFIANVIAVHADDKYIDKRTDKFRLDKANLVNYTHGHYYEQGAPIGKFGFSVEKKKKKK